MNIITKAFLSTILFGGLMYSMDASMSKEEFFNKYHQFKCFDLTLTNKEEFEILHKELINHINEPDKIFRSFRGLINDIHTQKMKMLPQEFIHYNGVNVSKDQLDQVKKKKLFKPHKRRQEIIILSPDQYVLDRDLDVIASIKKDVNNNNEN